jgi:GNAT superfamily N-acetyltransferase
MSDSTEPDSPEILFLTDNNKRCYKLDFYEYETFWRLRLFDQRIHVAEVECVVMKGVLFVGGLHVFDRARLPQGILANLLRSKFGLGDKTANYQRIGLGNKLLNLVIQRARKRKLIGITGNLFPGDLERNPDLPRWYRSKGFRVTMEKDNTRGKIEMEFY